MASATQLFNLSGPTHLSATDWNSTHHRTSIAASLVQGVYILERDRQNQRQGPQALAPLWWEFFHFQLNSVLVDDSDLSIFGAIYEFKFPPNPFSSPPRYAIAFRGTLTEPDTRSQDFKLDYQFIFVKNKLQKCSRVKQAMEAVQNMVNLAGHQNVWLAGHLLGSAIALVAGREMVKMGFHLETYLFNPPFSSAPLKQIKNDKLKHGARIASSVITAGLSVALTGHRPKPQPEDDPFIVLSGWTPYLFVNSHDPICSEYIGYFEHRQKMVSIGAGGIERLATQNSVGSLFSGVVLGRDSEPTHLLPTAYLVTNMSATENIKQAHGVEQWWTPHFNWHSKLHKYFFNYQFTLLFGS